jgi:hypothetical protein
MKANYYESEKVAGSSRAERATSVLLFAGETQERRKGARFRWAGLLQPG